MKALAPLLFFGLIIGGCLGIGWFYAAQEARVFNKFSTHGQKATMWDAIFANLRVEACR